MKNSNIWYWQMAKIGITWHFYVADVVMALSRVMITAHDERAMIANNPKRDRWWKQATIAKIDIYTPFAPRQHILPSSCRRRIELTWPARGIGRNMPASSLFGENIAARRRHGSGACALAVLRLLRGVCLEVTLEPSWLKPSSTPARKK